MAAKKAEDDTNEAKKLHETWDACIQKWMKKCVMLEPARGCASVPFVKSGKAKATSTRVFWLLERRTAPKRSKSQIMDQ